MTAALHVPTVGIGAGPYCDGQLLILHDMLGLNEGFNPRFLKRFATLGADARSAMARYVQEVRERSYPGTDHGALGVSWADPVAAQGRVAGAAPRQLFGAPASIQARMTSISSSGTGSPSSGMLPSTIISSRKLFSALPASTDGPKLGAHHYPFVLQQVEADLGADLAVLADRSVALGRTGSGRSATRR